MKISDLEPAQDLSRRIDSQREWIGPAIALLCLGTVSCFLFLMTPWDLRRGWLVIEEYAFFVLAAYLIERVIGSMPHRIWALRVSRIWVLASASGLLFLSICILGMRQFGGYDHSDLIESTWVQVTGLRPFVDFTYTKPPLFFMGLRLAYTIFGVRWKTFVLIDAVFAILTFLFLQKQFRRAGVSEWPSIFLALLVELGTTVLSSYWGYNTIASVVTIMVLVSSLVCLRDSESPANWLGLLISLLLLILGKPNSWLIGAALMPLLFSSKTRMLKTVGASSLAIVISLVACIKFGVAPVAILRTYSNLASSRGNPLGFQPLEDYSALEGLIIVTILLSTLFALSELLIHRRKELRAFWGEYFCCIVAVVTSLEMFATNYEVFTSNLMPLFISIFLVAYRPWSEKRLDQFSKRFVTYLLAFVLVTSVYWSITRQRVRGIGEFRFFEYPPSEVIRGGFFDGLHTGPRFVRVLSQISDVLTRNPSAKIFFGPRMEFGYAAFRLPAPRGLPIWWHPGTSFSETDLPQIVNSFARDDFDTLIFLKGDYTRIPSQLLFFIKHRYHLVRDSGSELDVYVKNTAADGT